MPCSMTTNTHSIRNVAVTARWDTALDIESQLPALEEILGVQRLGGPQQQHPPEGVFDETTCDLQEVDHALTMRADVRIFKTLMLRRSC